jgi:ketosteroid isomerase-like protein
MSEENVEIVRGLRDEFNAFMRGDLSSEAYAEPFDPQVELHWHDRQPYPDTPQHLRGVKELLAFNEQWRDGWADTALELLELIEAPGDRVLCFVRQSGRGRQSGVPIEFHYFQLWSFRDGKVSELQWFRHRDDALQAAGMSG